MKKNDTLKIGRFCLIPFLLFFLWQAGNAQTRQKYRTIDGTFNNLSNPNWGAANSPLFRELPVEYSDGKNALAGASRANTRAISNKLSNEPEDDHNDRGMAGLFYIWGQFIDHDMTSTQTGTEKAPISLPSDESKFSSPISFTRSAVFPGTGVTTPREQKNENNSFIDGSQVYGSNVETANWLRVFTGGKLWVSKGNLLPFNTYTKEESGFIDPNAPKMDDDNGGTKKTFVAGDHRAAEHPGLTSLHTLFVREHNKICDRLISQGYFDDETIYQIARKEVGALIQNITYGQWLYSMGIQLKAYSGYNSSVRPDVMNTFAAAAYRWHTMVENDVIFRDNDCHGVGPSELPLKEVFFNISIVQKYDIGVLLKGLSVHRQYETDLKVNNGLRNFLYAPTSGLDLVAINLQRGRDHGLPNYNTVRKFYTGSGATSFYDITSDGSIASNMQSLYGNVNNIDLWVGLFAEPHLSGKSVGKTLDAMMRAQFEKLRDGDFYFYMNDPELAADRSRIQSTKLSDIISRNSTAGNFQDNVFFRKSCSSSGDDIAHYSCTVTPQYDGWTFIGKQGSKTYYKWNGGNANFEDAKRLTARLGGHLPQMSNITDNNALKTYLAGGSTWLDLNRSGLLWNYSNTFDANDLVVKGALAPYFNWRAGEPNNVGGSENRVQITSTGQWNDIPESTLQSVIAEVYCDEPCATETTPPTFTSCPTNITASAGLLTLCKPVSWAVPTAKDNCSAVSVVQTSGLWNGSCFFSGTNNITYTATDARGNKSYCSFSVTVNKTFSLFLDGNQTLAMEANAEPKRTFIEWVNNTGYKNDFFTVEKINNATGQFEKLEIVNSQSNDKTQTQYVAYDNAPTEGDNTYRIKATFQDGTSTYSEAKTVQFKGLSDARIYPNPASDAFTIDLSNYKDQAVDIYLYNYLGQQILSQKIDKVENTEVEMNVANQLSGNYMIRIKSKNKREVTKSVTITH